MNWMELSIVVNHEVEYDVTEILESYGPNGVEIEDPNILKEHPV
ncbi:50S ribosomal protein L11 methyltransferase, partial [Staphylococcus epidermidis]|nr:50S ribosomal protein L11 methyltransferase [Staphylococcus epidermidis]